MTAGESEAGGAAISAAESGPEQEPTERRSDSVDLYGDPLPRGAIARLGTVRFRNEGWHQRICILPGGRTLASLSTDNSVRIWNADTGRLVDELDLGGKRPAAFGLSADGESLATLAQDFDREQREYHYELKLWRTSSWDSRSVAAWIGPMTEHAKCLAITPEGATVVTGGERGKLRFWDVGSGEERLTYSIAEREIEGLAFSPDGGLLAAATREGAFLWDWLSGGEPENLGRLPRGAQAVAFSPDGKWLATGSDDDFAARLWEVSSRRLVKRLTGDQRRYYRQGLAFSPDGKFLAVPGNRGHKVELLDVAGGELIRSLDAGQLEPHDVAISRSGRLAAAVGSGAAIKVWRLPDGEPVGDRFVGHAEAAYEIEFTPGGDSVVTGCLDGTIRIWDANTGRPLRLLEHDQAVGDLALSPDGSRIVSTAFDDTVRLWDIESGSQIYQLHGHGRVGALRTCEVGFVGDGERFLSFGPDLYLRVWSATTGKVLAERPIRPSGLSIHEREDGTIAGGGVRDPFAPGGRSIDKAQFTTDGGRLLLNVGNTVYVFDTQSGREVRKFDTEDRLADFAVSPDGRLLVTAESRQRPEEADAAEVVSQSTRWERILRVREFSSAETIRQIGPDGNPTQRMAFSPDARLLGACLSLRRANRPAEYWVSVWDLETGQDVARVEGLPGQVHQLAFSPDGKRLATSQNNTAVLVWDLDRFRLPAPDIGPRRP